MSLDLPLNGPANADGEYSSMLIEPNVVQSKYLDGPSLHHQALNCHLTQVIRQKVPDQHVVNAMHQLALRHPSLRSRFLGPVPERKIEILSEFKRPRVHRDSSPSVPDPADASAVFNIRETDSVRVADICVSHLFTDERSNEVILSEFDALLGGRELMPAPHPVMVIDGRYRRLAEQTLEYWLTSFRHKKHSGVGLTTPDFDAEQEDTIWCRRMVSVTGKLAERLLAFRPPFQTVPSFLLACIVVLLRRYGIPDPLLETFVQNRLPRATRSLVACLANEAFLDFGCAVGTAEQLSTEIYRAHTKALALGWFDRSKLISELRAFPESRYWDLCASVNLKMQRSVDAQVSASDADRPTARHSEILVSGLDSKTAFRDFYRPPHLNLGFSASIYGNALQIQIGATSRFTADYSVDDVVEDFIDVLLRMADTAPDDRVRP